MKRDQSHLTPSWDDCPPGVIQETALKGGAGPNLWLWGAFGLTLLLAGGTTYWDWVAEQPSRPFSKVIRQIDCCEARGNLRSFVLDPNIDPELRDSIVDHLQQCDCCCHLYKSICKKLRPKNPLPLKRCGCDSTSDMEP